MGSNEEEKMDHKSFSNRIITARVKREKRVIKLKKEPAVLAGFLIIKQFRPDLVPKFENNIG